MFEQKYALWMFIYSHRHYVREKKNIRTNKNEMKLSQTCAYYFVIIKNWPEEKDSKLHIFCRYTDTIKCLSVNDNAIISSTASNCFCHDILELSRSSFHNDDPGWCLSLLSVCASYTNILH